jgi:protein-disulfide isomerase
VCEALKKGSFHDYIDYIYSVQDSFSNNATAAMNAAQIVDAFATAATHIGIDENDFLTEFNNNPQHDMDARAQWKLGVSRGVSGTPMYFVNGVRVLSGNWGVQDWTDLINSLLQ